MNLSKEGKPEEMIELLPMLWMLIVGLAFLVVALQHYLFPGLRRTDEIPGVAELERLALPLLLALGASGIIRRRWLRAQATRSPESAAHPSREADGNGSESQLS
jgi:hypothetical protein